MVISEVFACEACARTTLVVILWKVPDNLKSQEIGQRSSFLILASKLKMAIFCVNSERLEADTNLAGVILRSPMGDPED